MVTSACCNRDALSLVAVWNREPFERFLCGPCREESVLRQYLSVCEDIWARHSYGFMLTYCGEPPAAEEWLVDTLKLDPRPPDYWREILAECRYMLHKFEAAIEIYTRWQNPPLHMYSQLAAAYAQLGRMDEARATFETFERLSPPDVDFVSYLEAHLRLCIRQEDTDIWTEGYRKAGFPVN